VRAAFSVPIRERGSPYEFKRLLRLALDGLIPSEVLQRQSKGAYDNTVCDAMVRMQPVLRQVMQDSILVELGVVEPAAVGRTIDLIETTPMSSMWSLDRLLSVEGWLRNLDTHQFTTPIKPNREQIRITEEQATDVEIPSADTRAFGVPRYVQAISSDTGVLVLFNQRTATYHPLDPVRSDMVRTLATTPDFEAAVAQLTAKYRGTDPDIIRADLGRCCAEFQTLGILDTSAAQSQNILPEKARTIRLTANEISMARNKTPDLRPQTRERVAVALGFVVGELLLNRVSPRAKIPFLQYIQKKWAKQQVSHAEAQRYLGAAQLLPHLGRIACAEAPYAAALGAALCRKNIDWHHGVSFAPLVLHAWIEAEGRPVFNSLDGQVTGQFQSFMA
jgi:hypothetical protein